MHVQGVDLQYLDYDSEIIFPVASVLFLGSEASPLSLTRYTIYHLDLPALITNTTMASIITHFTPLLSVSKIHIVRPRAASNGNEPFRPMNETYPTPGRMILWTPYLSNSPPHAACRDVVAEPQGCRCESLTSADQFHKATTLEAS